MKAIRFLSKKSLRIFAYRGGLWGLGFLVLSFLSACLFLQQFYDQPLSDQASVMLKNLKTESRPFIKEPTGEFWDGIEMAFGLYESSYVRTIDVEDRHGEMLSSLKKASKKAAGPLEREAAMSALMAGLLKNTDPHTLYFLSKDFKKIQQDVLGGFFGIGIAVFPKVDEKSKFYGWLIAEVWADGPAEEVGLRKKDIIVGLNHALFHSRQDMNIGLEEMKSQKSQELTLTIQRGTRHFDVSLTTRQVNNSGLSWTWLENGPLYVRLTGFKENIEEVLSQLSKLVDRQTPETIKRGMILDLRLNLGGAEETGIRVLSAFYGRGSLAIVHRNNRQTESFEPLQTSHRQIFPSDMPLVVLVNSLSASAAELVSISLRDRGRAVVMGNQTYGKGTRQTVFTLPDGSGLLLTTAFFSTPQGNSPQYQGVIPHYIFEVGPDILQYFPVIGKIPTERKEKGALKSPVHTPFIPRGRSVLARCPTPPAAIARFSQLDKDRLVGCALLYLEKGRDVFEKHIQLRPATAKDFVSF